MDICNIMLQKKNVRKLSQKSTRLLEMICSLNDATTKGKGKEELEVDAQWYEMWSDVQLR